jgi:signal transduction histidine kinase
MYMNREQVDGVNDSLFGGSFGIVAAAHELKSPVALIRQLALEIERSGVDTTQQELLAQIKLLSERSLRLTASLTKAQHLRDLSLFPLEPVNPQQLCEEVAHELFPLYRAHERTLRVRARRTPPLVIANRDLLRRILLQFGDNALHYTGSDAVTFSTWQRKGQVLVGLRDYGIQTSPGGYGHQNGAAGRPQGSGIGLRLAEQFAEAMNGQLGRKRHARGMTFYITMQPSEQLSLL